MRTLQEQLKEWKRKNIQVKKPREKKEELSFREIEELMGIRRAVYRRYRGAYRQR